MKIVLNRKTLITSQDLILQISFGAVVEVECGTHLCRNSATGKSESNARSTRTGKSLFIFSSYQAFVSYSCLSLR